MIQIRLALLLASCAAFHLDAQELVDTEPVGHRVMDFYFGAISDDSRYISYTDWSTGDLAFRDLDTGESHYLTHKGSWKVRGFALALQAISPDGKHVAYGWQTSFCDLRVVGIGDTESRVLYKNENIASILPKDWSSDGKHILATFLYKDGTDQMVLVSVADGSTNVLKTFNAASGSGTGAIMAFSPDGRFVAYDYRSNPTSSKHDIRVLAIDGKQDSTLVEHEANDYVLGWSPDGDQILFASDRGGILGAWTIQVVDGKPRGLPRLVRSGIAPIEWGMFTRDGSYYYARYDWQNDVYLTTFDPGKAQASTPRKLVSHVGFNTSAEWSPDGHHLAYAFGVGRYTDPFVLGIHSLETGEQVKFHLEMDRYGGHAFDPHWSPDGKALLGSGRKGIQRIDASTGEIELLVGIPGGCPGSGECIEWPVWAPDGRLVFARWNDASRRIFVRDPESGLEKEIYRVSPPADISQLAISKDAQRLAFVWSDTDSGASSLMVMPLTGASEARELYSLAPPEQRTPGFDARRGAILRPAWSPDSGHLFFTTIRTTSEVGGFDLWRIPSGGGEPEQIGPGMAGLRPYGVSVHPDGRRIALTAGTPRRQETWVMESILLQPATGDDEH